MNLEQIQQALHAEGLDGWLFYDFRRSNPIAHQVLKLPAEDMYTRRWFYFVPAHGTPSALISAVESHVLGSLPGERRVFQTWREMQAHLQAVLQRGMRIAMEYSPMNAIPYIARVDAGTLELVRSYGVEVVSSANLAQRFVAQLSDEQIESHREAGRRLIAAKDALFAALSDDLRAGVMLDEYSVQQRFITLLQHSGVILPEPGSIIADYTWMAFAGTRDEVPALQREVFEIVRRARDTGITFVRERLAAGQHVEGRQVDDTVRAVIANAGYGQYFIHRTGHSITTVDHGDGANNDNFETQDDRNLLTHSCCSIEPGIYLPEFGVRSEVNILIQERDVEVTGVPVQEEIVALV